MTNPKRQMPVPASDITRKSMI